MFGRFCNLRIVLMRRTDERWRELSSSGEYDGEEEDEEEEDDDDGCDISDRRLVTSSSTLHACVRMYSSGLIIFDLSACVINVIPSEADLSDLIFCRN